MNQHVDEKSDSVVVPTKPSNKREDSPAETVEGRTLPEGNSDQTTADRTQGRASASNGLMAVRRVAQQGKDVRFTALLHHINVELLERSYYALKRDAAPGIDGVTWQAYGERLEQSLLELHERIHKGSYRARPARRTIIPKPDGSERPLSILCLEDKLVQQAVVYVLEAIFEPAFLGFSYGFRPGRSQIDFLGFTHFCTQSRKTGRFVVGRKTIRKRMRARLQEIKLELRRRMHHSILETGMWLRRVLQGYLNYFAVSGNDHNLYAFFQQIRWYGLRALRRRSQKAYISWSRFVRLTNRFFPPIRLLHPHPVARFVARTQRRSPVR